MTKRFGTPGPRTLYPDMCEWRPLAVSSIGAQLLYDRLILQADDQGRLNGCPDIVRSRCLPFARQATARSIRRWLDELEHQELVIRYVIDATELLQIVKWWPEQAGMRRAYPSRWPPPDRWPDNVYGVPRDDRPGIRASDATKRESAGKVPQDAASCGDIPASACAGACAGAYASAGAEPHAPPTGESEASATPSTSPHHAFIAFWCAKFERIKSTRYGFDRGKDGKHVQAILELAGGDLSLAKERALALLTSNDPFYRDKGIDLGVLRSQWNRLGSVQRGPAASAGAAYQRFVSPEGSA